MLMIKNKRIRQIGALIETFNILALKLIIKNPSRFSLYPGIFFRNYMSLVTRDKWTSRGIFELFPVSKGVRISIEHSPGQGIIASIDELSYLAFITKIIEPKKIFEIGTFRGRTALNFAMNSPDDCKIYTLDLPEINREEAINASLDADKKIIISSITGVDYRGKPEQKKINQLFGNSLTFDYSSYANDMDIVFVDGAHYYDAVKSDTANAIKMAKSGGYVIWHDFANYGDYHDVTRGIFDMLPHNEVTQIENTQLAIWKKP